MNHAAAAYTAKLDQAASLHAEVAKWIAAHRAAGLHDFQIFAKLELLFATAAAAR